MSAMEVPMPIKSPDDHNNQFPNEPHVAISVVQPCWVRYPNTSPEKVAVLILTADA